MTMVICKECKANISTLAAACLHCGASKRKRPGYATVAIGLLGLTLLLNTWMLWRVYDIETRTMRSDIAHRSG